MKKNKVNLYKNGNVFGIESSCITEGEFLDTLSETLEEMISIGLFEDDWGFQLRGHSLCIWGHLQREPC